MAKQKEIALPEITEDLLLVAGHAYLNKALPEEAHRLAWGQAAFRAKVAEIQKSARRLSEKLTGLNEQQKFLLSTYLTGECIQQGKLEAGMDIDALAEFLSLTANAFGDIDESLIRPTATKAGPIEKQGYRALIRILLAWWWKETGRQPTYTSHDKSAEKDRESAIVKWVRDCISRMLGFTKDEPSEAIAAAFDALRHLNVPSQVRAVVAEINREPQKWYDNFVVCRR